MKTARTNIAKRGLVATPSIDTAQSVPSKLCYKLLYFDKLLVQRGSNSPICKQFQVGQIIKTGQQLYLQIDEKGLQLAVEILGGSKGIPKNAIRRYFTRSLSNNISAMEFAEEHGKDHLNGKAVPLSSYLKQKATNCTIYSALVQIAATSAGRESFFVQGTVILENDVGANHHAWNIVADEKGEFWNIDLALDCRGRILDIVIEDGYPILKIEDGKHEYSLV